MARAKYTKTTKTRTRKVGSGYEKCHICGGKGIVKKRRK